MEEFPEPESVKLGAAIVSGTVAEEVAVPDVPVIVRTAAPMAAVLLAVSVSRLLLVTGFGEKDAVTPLGSPVTVAV